MFLHLLCLVPTKYETVHKPVGTRGVGEPPSKRIFHTTDRTNGGSAESAADYRAVLVGLRDTARPFHSSLQTRALSWSLDKQ